jgi:hypothetical protein
MPIYREKAGKICNCTTECKAHGLDTEGILMN